MPENEELWYLVLHYKEQKQTVLIVPAGIYCLQGRQIRFIKFPDNLSFPANPHQDSYRYFIISFDDLGTKLKLLRFMEDDRERLEFFLNEKLNEREQVNDWLLK